MQRDTQGAAAPDPDPLTLLSTDTFWCFLLPFADLAAFPVLAKMSVSSASTVPLTLYVLVLWAVNDPLCWALWHSQTACWQASEYWVSGMFEMV